MNLEYLQKVASAAGDLASQDPVLVFALLWLAQAVGMAFSLPVKALLTLLAGALLGAFAGAVATLGGVLTGTSVLFFAARRLIRHRIAPRLGARAREVEQRLAKRPIRAMIGFRLCITLPHGPITIAASLTTMRYRDFIAGTLIGDLPVIVLYAVAGKELLSLSSVDEAISGSAGLILIAIGILLVASALAGRKQRLSER